MLNAFTRILGLGFAGLAVTLCFCLQVETSAQQTARQQVASPPQAPPAGSAASSASQSTGAAGRSVLDRYCVSCHNERVKTADLMLDRADIAQPGTNPEVWEKVLRK